MLNEYRLQMNVYRDILNRLTPILVYFADKSVFPIETNYFLCIYFKSFYRNRKSRNSWKSYLLAHRNRIVVCILRICRCIRNTFVFRRRIIRAVLVNHLNDFKYANGNTYKCIKVTKVVLYVREFSNKTTFKNDGQIIYCQSSENHVSTDKHGQVFVFHIKKNYNDFDWKKMLLRDFYKF